MKSMCSLLLRSLIAVWRFLVVVGGYRRDYRCWLQLVVLQVVVLVVVHQYPFAFDYCVGLSVVY